MEECSNHLDGQAILRLAQVQNAPPGYHARKTNGCCNFVIQRVNEALAKPPANSRPYGPSATDDVASRTYLINRFFE
jgi:hypothetical protein